MSFFEKTRNWYGHYERPISSLSLIGGFIFDAITLKRLDTLWENLWILGHIVLVAIFIVLIHIKEKGDDDERNPSKVHFWYVNILQFLFGGILSAFLVFYFRSTEILTTWPFLFILALAFIANESLKKYYTRLSFQISLLFLSIYSFAIFSIPIIVHKIGTWVFIISGLISLIFISIFVGIIFSFVKDKLMEGKKLTISLISGIFVLVNFLYFTNLIPPIPLSLKEAGVYYSINKNGDGNYRVTHEENNWKDYFKLYPDFNKNIVSPIYVYTAIFSPNDLDVNILHEWQFFNKKENKWITSSVVHLKVIGGRDGGFRTYSKQSSLSSGKWRVVVKTEQNKTIGSVRFNIVNTDLNILQIEEIKD